MSDVEIRRLKASELGDAPALLAAEGWPFEVEELERLEGLGGAVGAFREGTLVGFLTFVDMDPIRWVGNVVVAPDARGAGVGAKLVADALLDATRVGLYSVEKAVSLYERAGFVARGEAFALRAQSALPKRKVTPARQMVPDDGPGLVTLDKDAMGADRFPLLAKLIEAYPENVRVVRERNRVMAFGIAKTSPGLTEIGPIVAKTPQARDAILDALLALAPGPYEATVLGNNAGALKAFEERGFARRFRVVPMFKGEPPAWKSSLLMAAAGLEKG